MDLFVHSLFGRWLAALKKSIQLARESFVILPVLLHRLAIRFHFAQKIVKRSPSLSAMLAVLMPIIGQQREKDADRDEADLNQKVSECSLLVVKAHVEASKPPTVLIDH